MSKTNSFGNEKEKNNREQHLLSFNKDNYA